MPQVHGTRRGLTIVAVAALLLGGFASAHAALTTPACLAKKLKEWGNLRKCQATENGKALQGKSADPAKCQTKFDANAGEADREGDGGGDRVPVRGERRRHGDGLRHGAAVGEKDGLQ